MTAEWGEITAKEIIASIKGELISGDSGTVLTGLSTDSRKIVPGQIFLALTGERYDGHDFVEEALGKGATAIVVEKGRTLKTAQGSNAAIIAVADTLRALGDLANCWRCEHDVTVAAITGSMGKTTTKEMTANILGLGATTLKNEGNLNNLIGLPLTLLRLEGKHRKAVLEMGMNRPGEIGRLTEICEPDIGLITNVARVHLEGLNDIRGVARAKTELLKKISSKGQVILYGDDDLLMEEASRFSREVITYGTGSGNAIRGDKFKNLGHKGISFELLYRGNSVPIRIRVPGKQNLFNALAASAIAICMQEPFDHISEGLNRFDGIKGRFMPISLPGDITLVDDTYNSNPSSLKAALDSLKNLAGNRRRMIVGLGDMAELGSETKDAHLEAGAMVAELNASYFLAIGEHAREMIAGALKRGFPSGRAIEVESLQEMSQKIGDLKKGGDLIFLKGSRKMGLEQISLSLREMVNGELKCPD